jgi:DNA repair protein RadD
VSVHREELVRQISMTYANFGYRHTLLAPSDVISSIIHRQVRELGKSFVSTRQEKVTIGSVQTINSRADKLTQWSSQVKLWLTDECFVAGTLVDGKAIENIEIGDFVTAFDEHTGAMVKRRVMRLFKNKMPRDIVKVTTQNTVLFVTRHHPFYTQNGWVNAENLTNEHELLHLRFTGESKSTTNDVVSEVGSAILRKGMFEHTPRQSFIENNVSDKQKVCCGENAEQQSDAAPTRSRESVENAQEGGSLSENSRRERESTHESRTCADWNVRGVWFRDADCGDDWIPERCRPRPLQNRLRSSHNEDRDRSGRCFAQFNQQTGVRQAQGRFLDSTRVVSVQVLERDNPEIPGDGHVYNIEVDDLHTYTANGVVVHNCHHMLADNQWGKVASLFPNARGVGFTATPSRADRKSLARSQGGVFDAMVKGVTARQLIDEGYICDYRIIAPPSSINRETLRVGSTGDFTQKGLSSAREKSTITGDCVRTYLRYTPGEQAVVFAVDIAHATELTEAYREAGVTAETVSSKTPKAIRKSVMDKFERGIFNVLVNVDLFGEGLNVEGISVVQMARPTKSFPLYVQQFFRALTAADGKHLGTIIDHAGNVAYFGKFFGLPDAYNGWKLEADEFGRRGTRDETLIPVKTCVECFMAYPGTATECPFCGHKPEPEGRDRPEQVEGDLVELTPAMLAELRAAVSDLDARLDMPAIPHGANQIVTKGIKNRAAAHRSAQDELRDAIALWAGIWRERGEADRVIHKRFWFRFGTDILTAQALGARDAESLTLRIKESYNET